MRPRTVLKTPPRLIVVRMAWTVLAVVTMSGCGQESASSVESNFAAVTAEGSALHPVVIRQAPVPRDVIAAHTGSSREPVLLSCRSCHANLDPNPETSATADLDQFHQDLQFRHGDLKCVSCHNPADEYESLRLADGQTLPYSESMRLCAQCHGTQYDDYLHGSHGGMTGYWDLARGGRVRNHCLHCHDTHVPHYPVFQPASPPRDRFRPVVPEESHE